MLRSVATLWDSSLLQVNSRIESCPGDASTLDDRYDEKDNDISRVASGLRWQPLWHLVIIGWIVAVVTSGEANQQAGTVVARTIRHFLPDDVTSHLSSATPYSINRLGNLGSCIRQDDRFASHSFGLSAGERLPSGRYRLCLIAILVSRTQGVHSELTWFARWSAGASDLYDPSEESAEKPSSAIRRENKGTARLRIWGDAIRRSSKGLQPDEPRCGANASNTYSARTRPTRATPLRGAYRRYADACQLFASLACVVFEAVLRALFMAFSCR